jgi:hypothetical protein
LITDFYLGGQVQRAEPRAAAVPDATDAYGFYDKRMVADFLFWTAQANAAYIAAAVIHVVNALSFGYVWRTHINEATGRGFDWCSYVQVPEVFNLMEATLYLASACLYDKQVPLNKSVDGVLIVPNTAFQDGVTADVKRIELAASLSGIAACAGWWVTWWMTHERGPGRGLTLDDPEPWALFFLTATYIIYVAYNVL